jgi:hypothetical protein
MIKTNKEKDARGRETQNAQKAKTSPNLVRKREKTMMTMMSRTNPVAVFCCMGV